MFEETKKEFYESLSNSIKNRKKDLNLKRWDILLDETRVSKIVNNTRNEHHPYLIGKGEYPYLIYLFLYDNHDSFIDAKILETPEDELIKKCGNNYDKMLWEHIDWDKMFQDVITELSKLEILEDTKELKELEKRLNPKKLEEQKKMEKLFKDTLVDYAPYAVIRYDELPFEYGRIKIFPDEREEKKQKAIKRVHLRYGSELFKQTFLEKFSGKTLREFDKGFSEFVSEYLMKRMPDKYSVGLQAYEFHKNLSEYVVCWQRLPEVQYGDISDKKSELYILLNEYQKYGKEHMKKLEKCQRKFDKLHIDIE